MIEMEGIFALVIVFFIIGIGMIGVEIYQSPYRETDELLETAGVSSTVNFANDNSYPTEGKTKVKDAWGTEIAYELEVTEDYITSHLTSAGKDKKFGTKHDITKTVTKQNRARLDGEKLGSDLKEFANGFFEGLEKETPFSESDNVSNNPTSEQDKSL